MKRLAIILIALVLTSVSYAQIMYNPIRLSQIKHEIEQGKHSEAFQKLLADADNRLNKSATSVMDKKHIPASGNKHDYMSLSIYYWPDSTKADGRPYIPRDGYFNPQYKEHDWYNLEKMTSDFSILALAWYHSRKDKYAGKALELLRTWFINPETRMTPHMNYAQVRPGHNNDAGHPTGVLDGNVIARMINSVLLFDDCKLYTKHDRKTFRQWVKSFAYWIEHSDLGKANAAYDNNIGIAYDMQLSTYLLFLGNSKKAKKILQDFPQRRMIKQIAADGSMPAELRRNKSYSYTWYNLGFLIDVLLIAKNQGWNIDEVSNADGASFYKAIDFASSYIGVQQSQWPYKQVNSWDTTQNEAKMEMHRVAHGLNNNYLPLVLKNPIEKNHLLNLLY